jgi:hypothetical protein
MIIKGGINMINFAIPIDEATYNRYASYETKNKGHEKPFGFRTLSGDYIVIAHGSPEGLIQVGSDLLDPASFADYIRKTSKIIEDSEYLNVICCFGRNVQKLADAMCVKNFFCINPDAKEVLVNGAHSACFINESGDLEYEITVQTKEG